MTVKDKKETLKKALELFDNTDFDLITQTLPS